MPDGAEKSKVTMTSSKAFNKSGSRADLFADSFDSWIETSEATSQDSPPKNAPDAIDTMKWSAWTESEVVSDRSSESDGNFGTAVPMRRAERLLNGVAWAVAALTALLLIVSLLSFGMARLRRPAPIAKATAIISASKSTAKSNTQSVTLPAPIVRRVAVSKISKTRSAPKFRAKMARVTQRRAPEPQAIILGRGPVREDTRSIILIHD